MGPDACHPHVLVLQQGSLDDRPLRLLWRRHPFQRAGRGEHHHRLQVFKQRRSSNAVGRSHRLHALTGQRLPPPHQGRDSFPQQQRQFEWRGTVRRQRQLPDHGWLHVHVSVLLWALCDCDASSWSVTIVLHTWILQQLAILKHRNLTVRELSLFSTSLACCWDATRG